MITDNVISQLQVDEGFSDKPYKDSVGKLTIGFGWCLDTQPLPRDLATTILKYFTQKKWLELSSKAPWILKLPELIQESLLNMAFNLGVEGLLSFNTFLSLVQAGDYSGAADDLRKTLWFKQVGNRAERIYLTLKSLH